MNGISVMVFIGFCSKLVDARSAPLTLLLNAPPFGIMQGGPGTQMLLFFWNFMLGLICNDDVSRFDLNSQVNCDYIMQAVLQYILLWFAFLPVAIRFRGGVRGRASVLLYSNMIHIVRIHTKWPSGKILFF